jgi:N-acetylmuramic acid 6-phosphate etherase
MSDQAGIEQLGGLPTEARNPRSEQLDGMATVALLETINDEDATIAAAVRAQLPAIARCVDAIAERFAGGGRLFYAGAGTSGRLGVLDASECPPTFSVEPGLFVGLIAGGDAALRRSSEQSEDSPEQGAADLRAHDPAEADTVLGIAASGRTPYVIGALKAAQAVGALTVALTCAGGTGRQSALAEVAEMAIEIATGAEVLTGSTRMKAGTATKMVLNMFSTAVMVRRGAVFGNLMVNVQPTNVKLVDRAERIIAAATDCDRAEAARLLHEVRAREAADPRDGRESSAVKLAILMQRRGLPYAAARAKLHAAEGNLRAALEV